MDATVYGEARKRADSNANIVNSMILLRNKEQEDIKELLALLNAHDVEYVIVGAYALSHHGVPRYTGDLDILIRAETENAH